jgi:hypothetical protein
MRFFKLFLYITCSSPQNEAKWNCQEPKKGASYMQKLIIWLFSYINHQQQIINYLCVLVFGKNFKPKPKKCTDKKYLKLSVDPMPVFGKPKIIQLWDFRVLLQNYRDKHGKDLPLMLHHIF